MAFNKEKVMDAARKFVDKGQIDKAVKEYLRIVSEDPKDVRVWLKIGDLYAKKGSKQDAVETYLKVARFYHDQGFFLKAVAVYKQILKLDPRLVDVILKLAELYRQLGLMSDAMQHFESVAAHFHREGNTKEALATVKKLVDLDPENIATRIKLAELYSKEGLVDDAAEQFIVACDQLRRQGRQDDFVKVAERLLWHKPDNHALNRELAGLYLRRNDPRRALQKLQACFKADPRDVETLGLLAQAFQALDQKAKTVSVLKEMARVHVENKHKDKALDVYRKILEFVPNDPDAKDFLGQSAPPPAAAAPKPPPPPTRVSTPIPAAVRQADPKFNITSDLPRMDQAAASRMTGSMPLVDETSLSGDFALPEYDDADFSADMEPAPDPRSLSAAGERHAEEISKILAETDVYVKYGLHQKAVDHLRRVFGLDPDNVEAHERLKDIFLSQGREQEAEVELLKLAELVASADPDRAEHYLQELLALNGTHTGAFDLARRFRLRVARMSSNVSDVDYRGGGGVAPIDVEMDDLGHLDLAAPPRVAVGVARGQQRYEEVDDDLDDPRVANGSPADRPLPSAPRGYQQGYDFEHNTAQTSLEDVEPIVDRPGHWQDGETRQNDALLDAVDAQLDDDELGEDIDSEVAAELAAAHAEDLPFDPAAARAFDAAVPNGTPPRTAPQYVSGFEETDLPARASDQFDIDDPLSVSGSYDPYGTGNANTPSFEHTAANAVDPSHYYAGADDSVDDPPAEAPRGESSVEDDVDEADFYVGQGMYAEALEVLRRLQRQYPNRRLILEKLREVEAYLEGGDPMDPGLANDSGTGTGTDAISLDEIEEVPVDDLDDMSSGPTRRPAGNIGRAKVPRQPSIMLEHAVDANDAATHYDLGLAYKEMGLHDEAVKAFEKALVAPGREAQCRVMIGMCYREANNPTEAIHQFKQGLHAEPSDREQLSIFYEIGMTYESIEDWPEALYYYETVSKRDPNFADAAARAEALRDRGTPSHSSLDDDL